MSQSERERERETLVSATVEKDTREDGRVPTEVGSGDRGMHIDTSPQN